MAVKLAFNRIEQFCDGTGIPYSGAKLFTYSAGSSTKLTTYTESTGSSANTNPIVLDSSGRMPQPVWLTVGSTYKFVLSPSTDADPPTSPIWSMDNISGINDASLTIDQWVSSGLTPTYVSATSFTLAGDQTSAFHVGRRLKTTNTAGTVYSTISASVFGALTTVTVVNDSTTLDSGLSAVSYGLLTNTNPSLPSIRAKGDILSLSAAGTLSRVAVGVNGADLEADSTQTEGLLWRKRNVVQALVDAANIDWDTSAGQFATITLTAARNFNAPTSLKPGFYVLLLTSGGFSPTFNAVFKGINGGGIPAPASSGMTAYVFQSDGTNLYLASLPVFNTLTASLGSDTALNSAGTWIDGPSVAQGSVGIFLAWGTVTFNNVTANSAFNAKLYDGTNTAAASSIRGSGNGADFTSLSLSGFFTNPPGNIRLAGKEDAFATAKMAFNHTGTSKDTTINVARIG